MTNFNVMALAVLASATVAGAASATTQTSVAYDCDAGSKALARYDTTTPQGGVSVIFGGNMIALGSAASGSGARYVTAAGPHAISPLEWWSKGRDATFSELATHGGANRLIATCHAAK